MVRAVRPRDDEPVLTPDDVYALEQLRLQRQLLLHPVKDLEVGAEAL
jgi:hypothetical protein